MKIGVIGTGGVGGYFGGKLCFFNNNENDIYFIARNEHLKEIQKNGLILDSDDGEFICKPAMATDKISELPVLDLCFLCVKGYDIETVLKELVPKVAERTIIIPLLNGVDIYERTRKIIKNGVVLPACVYVGTHIESPGIVKQRGGSCTIHFGNDPENSYFDDNIFKLLNKSKIKYSWIPDPFVEIWSKFMFIASYGMVTARYGKTIGEVLESDEMSDSVKNVMNEIYDIARCKKINLPETIVSDSFEKGKKFPYETKTSFQRDFETVSKKDERDLFGGAILRMGSEYNVKTAETGILYDALNRIKSIQMVS